MRKTTFFAAAVILLASLSAAATPAFITTGDALNGWLPVVAVALVLGVSITAAYYMAGVLLNSSKIKAAAVGELGQAIGGAIIVVAVLVGIVFFESGQLSLVSVVSPASMGTVCGQLSNSNVIFLQNGEGGGDTLTDVVCSQISSLGGAGGSTSFDPASSLTQRMDYGLFANYVIMANVSSQMADNLQSLYLYESWIGFLSKFNVSVKWCMPSCVAISSGLALNPLSVGVSFFPLQGYEKLGAFTEPLEFEADMSFYILFIQLLMVSFFLFAWPYLIAAGMILRSTFFTRRLGGLLIAIGIVIVLIYPLMTVLEYSAFTNTKLTPIGPTVLPAGAASLNSMVLCEAVPNGPSGAGASVASGGCTNQPWPAGPMPMGTHAVAYGSQGINFFVLPNAGEIIDYYGCMPSAPGLPRNLPAAEATFAGMYLIPGVGLGTALLDAVGGLAGAVPIVPPLALGVVGQCGPDNALSTMLALVNMYGIVFIEGVFMPLLNVLVALAATISLSKLFGGDTDIMGLSKLV